MWPLCSDRWVVDPPLLSKSVYCNNEKIFFLHNLFDAAQKGFREATMKHCLWIGFNGIYWELFVLLEWVVMFRPNFSFSYSIFVLFVCQSETWRWFFFCHYYSYQWLNISQSGKFGAKLKKTGVPLACASALSLSNIRSNSHALSRSG